ncbi:hypothetical protein SEVIR_3G423001v4 [Setaria viridis]
MERDVLGLKPSSWVMHRAALLLARLMADWYSTCGMNKDSSACCCRLDGSVVCMHSFTCIISITVGATKKLAVCLISLAKSCRNCWSSWSLSGGNFSTYFLCPKCMHPHPLATDRDAELLGPFRP